MSVHPSINEKVHYRCANEVLTGWLRLEQNLFGEYELFIEDEVSALKKKVLIVFPSNTHNSVVETTAALYINSFLKGS